MAFADYNQSQATAQIQAYFLLKRATDPDFLKDLPLDPANGELGGPESPTRKAVQRYLDQAGAGSQVAADSPNFLENAYWHISTRMVQDKLVHERINIMKAGQTRDPAEMTTREQQLQEERQRLENLVNEGRERIRQIEQDVKAGKRSDYGNASELRVQYAYQAVDLERANTELDHIRIAREVQRNPEQQRLLQNAGNLLEEGRNAPAKNPVTARQEAAAQPPQQPQQPLQADAYSTYFINNFVLNRSDYSPHAARVWHKMKAEQLSPGDAIDRYMEEEYMQRARQYVSEREAQYRETHGGRRMPADLKNRLVNEQQQIYAQAGDVKNQLIREMAALRNIEVSIQGVKPTPQQLADNFVKTKVLPAMHEGTRDVFRTIEEKGKTFDEAANDYLNRTNQGQNADLRNQIKSELFAVSRIRDGVAKYEGVNVTPEDTLRIMRSGWEQRGQIVETAAAQSRGIPADPKEQVEHYSKMLEQRIAHYQTTGGGGLDAQTASARAAVDIRGQIDLDRGVSRHMVVDQNHGLYRNDILQMENFLRGRINVARNGAIPASEAVAQGARAEDVNGSMSTLDFYGQRYGVAYGLHRRQNVEQTMIKTYAERGPAAAPAPGQGADKRADAAPKAPAEKADAPAKADAAPAKGQTLAAAAPPNEEVKAAVTQLRESWDNYLAALPERTPADQMRFIQQGNQKLEAVQQALEKGNSAEALKGAHDFASFARKGMEQQQTAIVERYWKNLQPYLRRQGVDAGPQEYSKGVDFIRDNPERLGKFHVRGLTFNQMQEHFEKFGTHAQAVKDVAGRNGIDLSPPAAAPAPAQPQDPELQQHQNNTGAQMAI